MLTLNSHPSPFKDNGWNEKSGELNVTLKNKSNRMNEFLKHNEKGILKSELYLFPQPIFIFWLFFHICLHLLEISVCIDYCQCITKLYFYLSL